MTPRTFVVPGEPHAWERARQQGKRLFTSATMRDAHDNVRRAARLAHLSPPPEPCPMGLDVVGSWLFPRGWSLPRIEGELVRLGMDPHRVGSPKCTRPDVDNIGKLVADALNPRKFADGSPDHAGAAYEDDGLLWLVRFATVWGPRAETHVRVWYGEDAPPFPDRWW